MKNIIKDLLRYTTIILLVVFIGINSYNINQNNIHCKTTANDNIILSDNVKNLTMSLTNFTKCYVEIRQNDLLKQQENTNNIHFLSTQFMENARSVLKIGELCLAQSTELNNKINTIHQQPSFQYLKSVTVFITGETIPTPSSKKHTVWTKKLCSNAWCGTGVVVKIDDTSTYILTNKHVAGGYQSLPVIISILLNGETYICDILKLHHSEDLALLKIDKVLPGLQCVKGIAYPETTEQVFTVGHSLGRPYMYGEGVYSGTTMSCDIYQLPCISGQSGSGIFSKEGYLLGLIYSMSGTYINGNRQYDFTRANCVKGIYLKEFLLENI